MTENMHPRVPTWMLDWPRSAPRPTGPWTVTDGSRYGLLDPEKGSVTPVDPAIDPRLPGLAAALGDGQELIAYRHRRRAVTRQNGSFTKILRANRAAAIAEHHELLENAAGFHVPTVIDCSKDGRVRIEAIDGCSLHDLLRAGDRIPIREVAAAIGAFNATVLAPDALAPAEADTPARWIDIVGRIAPSLRRPLQQVADTLPPLDVAGSVVVHTDLHDKNVLLNERGVHIIDLDGLALGAPEIDAVNLAVHLELRALQGEGDPIEGRRRFDRFIDAYDAALSLDAARVAAIERHTWFRLACLYLCRASSSELPGALLQRASRTHDAPSVA